ncbi:MAG: hypothetical protein ACPGWR_30140, partial [Ardenticatenaceae bacterium]
GGLFFAVRCATFSGWAFVAMVKKRHSKIEILRSAQDDMSRDAGVATNLKSVRSLPRSEAAFRKI